MNHRKNGFLEACLVQLGLFLVAFMLWFYFRTEALLAGPPLADSYAQSWSFQFAVGAFYLVICLAALAAVFLAEAILLKIYRHFAGTERGHSGTP